jgi:formylglycine-generating enzyme required for sulfatase activity
MWTFICLVGILLSTSLAVDDVAYSDKVELTQLADIPGGTFWFGSQMTVADKIMPSAAKDGASPRVTKTVKSFQMDVHTVTNLQFSAFVNATNFVSEAETFTWSFVLEHLASANVVKQVDSKKGYGRVKDSTHWMAVPNAYWAKPYGKDSGDILSEEARDLPVVHVSFNDAKSYCKWAGRHLPTEVEWEYAARGGRIKQNYPWGNDFKPASMNVWEGDFPKENVLQDGFLGPAPVKTYAPNKYGLYNMVGNVWEWVAGGKAAARTLRGGSFVDSADGSFNHVVLVSTRQENSADSTASNVGFRCARSLTAKPAAGDHIEL